MSEIKSLLNVIDAVFARSDVDSISKLRGHIDKIQSAIHRRVDHNWQECSSYKEADEARLELADLKNQSADIYKRALELMMIARRATYPLKRETPWGPEQDPRDALYDEDDPYSWVIYDGLLDSIQELLPPLYQLACESDK